MADRRILRSAAPLCSRDEQHTAGVGARHCRNISYRRADARLRTGMHAPQSNTSAVPAQACTLCRPGPQVTAATGHRAQQSSYIIPVRSISPAWPPTRATQSEPSSVHMVFACVVYTPQMTYQPGDTSETLASYMEDLYHIVAPDPKAVVNHPHFRLAIFVTATHPWTHSLPDWLLQTVFYGLLVSHALPSSNCNLCSCGQSSEETHEHCTRTLCVHVLCLSLHASGTCVCVCVCVCVQAANVVSESVLHTLQHRLCFYSGPEPPPFVDQQAVTCVPLTPDNLHQASELGDSSTLGYTLSRTGRTHARTATGARERGSCFLSPSVRRCCTRPHACPSTLRCAAFHARSRVRELHAMLSASCRASMS